MTRALRICIVTDDIVGPIRNGGIGTAYYSLAVAMARAGHDVTVLFGLGLHCEVKTIAHWREHYRSLGITFVPVPDAPFEVKGSWAVKAAYRVHFWLQQHTFDVVHFHEWRGIGYYALLAQRQGLSLQGTVTCVGAHSPTFWHKEGMRETPADAQDFELDFMERESVRLADVVWFPSRHMAGWMATRQWPEPRRSFVRQYVMLDGVGPARSRQPSSLASEFVFFGRLETRKGLDLFCDALDVLATRGRMPTRVTFMGKVASVDGVDSRTYLERRSRRWSSVKWRIESDFDRDQALAYLKQPGRLAVLPSRIDNLPYTVLECLGAAIPFVSSDTGGIPEMVAESDHAHVLFPLDAARCADALQVAIEEGIRPARLAVSTDKTSAEWERWHEQVTKRAPRATARIGTPKVSICVTHRNRPAFLKQALASIEKQTYVNFEVVLVDDGSDAPDAIAFLDTLAPAFATRGWTLLRQQNRYPGAARNAAARAATGKYLLFMDDDNIAKPHEVSTFVRAIQASGAEIATCFLDVFQGKRPPRRIGTASFRWTFLGPSTAIGSTVNCFGDTNCLIERSTFERLGGFTEDFGVGFEDWELLAKAALAGCAMTIVPEALVWYRQTGVGVNSTTAFEKNHMRALRPYLEKLPPEHRNLVLMAKRATLAGSATALGPAPAPPEPLPLDHVRDVVVFGAGSGGQLAIKLADACGWKVPYIVDNNTSLWHTTVHDRDVKPPTALESRDFDLVLVASYAGKDPLFAQLEQMGFSYGEDFAHFLDTVQVNRVQHRVTL